jgi:hypothetical protein
MYIPNYELTIGDYTICVNITLTHIKDSFDHEFGSQDASYYEVSEVELSEPQYKHLFDLDYITEMVEETLDVAQYLN